MKICLIGVLLMLCSFSANGFSEKILVIDGIHINYIDEGEGEALVLIHGLGADLSRWEYNIAGLSSANRVIAIDLPGFGKSGREGTSYNGQYYVDVIEKIRVSLGIDKITLIGNSMGGWLSLLYSLQHPENVNDLVLIAPAFVKGLPEGLTPENLVKGANPQTVGEMQDYLHRVLFNPQYSVEEIQSLLEIHSQRNKGDAIEQIAWALHRKEDVLDEDELGNVTMPTLIIHGDADGIVPYSASASLQSLIRHSKLKILPEAGHWPQWEKPDTVNSLILSFVNEMP